MWAPSLGTSGHVVAYGHWGPPVLFFPSERGSAYDIEANGIIHVLAPAIEAGRLKVYAVDVNDGASWSNNSIPTEERARNHEAYHAVNLALRRADLFPRAVGMSGNYDPGSWNAWGEAGTSLYFNNPTAFVPNLHGEHLEWLRNRVFIQLVVGSGAFEEHPTRALQSSWQLAHALWDMGIPCNLDVWGTDTPHDWPSWQRMAVKHLTDLG